MFRKKKIEEGVEKFWKTFEVWQGRAQEVYVHARYVGPTLVRTWVWDPSENEKNEIIFKLFTSNVYIVTSGALGHILSISTDSFLISKKIVIGDRRVQFPRR